MDYSKVTKEPKVTVVTKEKQHVNTNVVRELKTVQTKEKLNNVYSLDEKGPGNAHHKYKIGDICELQFQKGPRNEDGSTAGILDCDLLEIVRDRLTSFQSGPYACVENQAALDGVCHALVALNKRVLDRIERRVLGLNEK